MTTTITRKRLVADIARKIRITNGQNDENAIDEIVSEHDYLGRAFDHWAGDWATQPQKSRRLRNDIMREARKVY